MKKYICFLLFLLCFITTKAQNLPNFSRNYDFPPDYALILTDIFPTDTGYYVVGTMVDSAYRVWAGTFFFTDLNGSVQDFKKFSRVDTSVYFMSDIVENNAGFLLGGSYAVKDNSGTYLEHNSIWQINYNGEIIWQKIQQFGNNQLTSVEVLNTINNQIWAKKLVATNYRLELLNIVGNFIKGQDIVLPNITPNLYGSIQKVGENIMVACSDYNTITDEQRHFFYVKDTAFNTVDSFYLSGRYGALKHLDKIDDNTFAVSGQRVIANGTDIAHPHIYTLDSNLNRTMNSTIRGDRAGNLNSATRTFVNEDGSLTVLGTSVIEQQGTEIGFMAKVSRSGQLLWQRGLYSPQNSYTMYNAAQTSDGGYIVCGDVLGISTGYYQQGWLMKVDSNGCVLPNCHLAAEEVAETKQPAMLLYPNPATDYINIQVALPEAVEVAPAFIELIDNKGRVLETRELYMQDLAYQFYLYNYVAGHYAIRVRQGNKQATKQFVKGR